MSRGSPSSDVTERDAKVVRLRASGMTLDAIGAEVGLTRERVRQICAREGVETPPKHAKLQSVVERRNERIALVERFLLANPGATTAEIASEVGIEPNLVSKHVPREFRRLVLWESGSRPMPVWSDADILIALRTAATYEFPLTANKYRALVDMGEIRGPSVPRIHQRFGQWSAACEAAGVEYGVTHIEYTSRWTDADITRFVVLYLSDSNYTGAAHRYDEWRVSERLDAPSLGTVRNRFGDWESAKIAAYMMMREQLVQDGAEE